MFILILNRTIESPYLYLNISLQTYICIWCESSAKLILNLLIYKIPKVCPRETLAWGSDIVCSDKSRFSLASLIEIISIDRCAGDSVWGLLNGSHRVHSARFQPKLTLIHSADMGVAASQDLLCLMWQICACLPGWACSVLRESLLFNYIRSSV